ncbi:MAG TPA: helix-turn-helix transcriptional regulator [Pirellulales bacterium]|nr:helix-turn-helix transcriptional regulator [Pirellulales bacterium]
MAKAINRVKVVKAKPSKAQRRKLKAIRDNYQSKKPSLADLAASAEYTDPISQGEFWELAEAARALKAERQKAGVTLARVAELSGIDAAALSRLENGIYDNPTTTTLSRYAHALGKVMVFSLEDDPTAARAARR